MCLTSASAGSYSSEEWNPRYGLNARGVILSGGWLTHSPVGNYQAPGIASPPGQCSAELPTASPCLLCRRIAGLRVARRGWLVTPGPPLKIAELSQPFPFGHRSPPLRQNTPSPVPQSTTHWAIFRPQAGRSHLPWRLRPESPSSSPGGRQLAGYEGRTGSVAPAAKGKADMTGARHRKTSSHIGRLPSPPSLEPSICPSAPVARGISLARSHVLSPGSGPLFLA